MMMRTPSQKTLFLLLFCMLTSLYVEAQRPRILRRVEDRVRNRANREVDKAVDQVIDSLLTDEKQQRQDGDPQLEGEPGDSVQYQGGGISISSSEFEPYQNPMLVNFSMDMTVTNNRNKKEEKSTIHCTMDTWQTGVEVQNEEMNMRVLLDNKEGYMTTVTEDEDGEIQAMRMRQRKFNVDNIRPDESEFKVTRTGNFRTIDGYRCEEVIIEHEDGTTTAWVTNDIEMDFTNAFAAMSGGNRGANGMTNPDIYGIGGFPIESTSISKNGKETTFTKFYDFKTGDDIDRSVFDLDGIEVMNLGY